MTRQEIRGLVRLLADELTEAPQGLFLDTELNSLINISKDNVYLALIDYVPWQFRKSFYLSLTATKDTYDVVTDLSVSDFFLIEDILNNRTGERATPLLHVDIDQIWEHVYVGEIGRPKIWYYESKTVLGLKPITSETLANAFKCFYFPVLPDLNDDTTHTPPTKIAIPDLPTVAHSLIAYDVLKDWHIRDEEESADVKQRYLDRLMDVVQRLSARQGTTFEPRLPVKEMVK
jgi:hypothetical protein